MHFFTTLTYLCCSESCSYNRNPKKLSSRPYDICFIIWLPVLIFRYSGFLVYVSQIECWRAENLLCSFTVLYSAKRSSWALPNNCINTTVAFGGIYSLSNGLNVPGIVWAIATRLLTTFISLLDIPTPRAPFLWFDMLQKTCFLGLNIF